ncbi:MAG: hypothetical protein WBF90_07265 [Rivularia sp. (in: cyanobacteria)]
MHSKVEPWNERSTEAFQGRTLEREKPWNERSTPGSNYQCPMPYAPCPIPYPYCLQKYAKCAKIVPNNGDYSSIIWNNLAFFLI